MKNVFRCLPAQDHSGNNAAYSSTGAYGGTGGTNAYDGYNTSSQYDVQAGNPSSTYGYQSAYVPPSSSAQPSYDPYRPAAAPVSQQHQANAYDQKAASAYDPYKPSGFSSQQAPTASYTPAATTSYEPYKPPATDTGAHYLGLPHSNTFVSGSSLIPPPSAVDTSKPPASPYRPSTANAYDPPIPVIKPKKSFSASAYHSHGGPYSSQTPTSPPLPPPGRKPSSPPRSTSSLTSPPPPPRSILRSPPTSSTISYAQPSFRSSSPYDPPISRQHGSPKPHTYSHYPSPQQINGQYTSPTSLSPPISQIPLGEQRPVDSVVGQEVGTSAQYPTNIHYGETASYAPREAASVLSSTVNETTHQEGLVHAEEFGYSAQSDLTYSVSTGPRTTSRPGSSHSSVSPTSPRRPSQSPASERRSRMSSDATMHSGRSQRGVSPASESPRSQNSLGRGSPVYNRAGTSLVGQSFSALDEETLKQEEPRSFVKRRSLERADSPSPRSVGSVGSYAGMPCIVHMY